MNKDIIFENKDFSKTTNGFHPNKGSNTNMSSTTTNSQVNPTINTLKPLNPLKLTENSIQGLKSIISSKKLQTIIDTKEAKEIKDAVQKPELKEVKPELKRGSSIEVLKKRDSSKGIGSNINNIPNIPNMNNMTVSKSVNIFQNDEDISPILSKEISTIINKNIPITKKPQSKFITSNKVPLNDNKDKKEDESPTKKRDTKDIKDIKQPIKLLIKRDSSKVLKL